MSHRRKRRRILWLALIGLVIVLGLGSRHSAGHLPRFLASYAGDTLWALAVFFTIGLVLPSVSTRCVALLATMVSLLVEVGQLSRAPWIESIRRTTLGGLVLGHDFVWSDLTCYAVGVCLGILIELVCLHDRSAAGTRRPCS